MNNIAIPLIMKNYLKTIASTMVMFALVLSALVTPFATANAVSTGFGSQFDFGPSFDFGSSFGFEQENLVDSSDSSTESSVSSVNSSDTSGSQTESTESESSSVSSYTNTTCSLTATRNNILAGESTTLNWNTSGFTDIKINGETVTGNSGSKTFDNIQVRTTFVLTASNSSGSTCTQQVIVNCEPPVIPKYCELEVTKTVDKVSAIVGDSLTYTITVKNIGGADCSGGGVKIEDVIDSNIRYISNTVTSNLNAGYENLPVYTSSDRTLHFNGNVLTPGETGTITWVGEIQTPTQCGDFEVKNQAKATAVELDNFKNWAYSGIVKTTVDNDCAPKPCELTLNKTVDKTTAKPGDNLVYTITIKNTGSVNCTGSGVKIEDVLDTNIKYVIHTLTSNLGAGYVDKPVYTSADRTLHFNGFVLEPGESGKITVTGKVLSPTQCGDFEVKNQAKATAIELNNFTTWVYSPIVTTFIDNDCTVPKVPECTLTPTLQTIEYGAKATLSWTTDNAHTVSITDLGTVPLNGSSLTSALFTGKRYILTALGDGGQVYCYADVKVGDPKDKFAEIIAHKIICTDESELPNYGNGGPDITANTAADWVNSHNSCSFASEWEFEWTDNQSNDPTDDFIGKVGLPWKAFGPTNDMGKTNVTINLTDLTNNRVWLREVLKTNYIPFTHSLNGGTNVDDVSAEFYCNTDVINYDNRDFVENMVDGGKYYCVAWNSPVQETPPPSCDLFTATPGTIMVGASSTLAWESTNAVQAFLNNGIGAVNVDGSVVVSPVSNTVYKLTLIGAEDKTVDCEIPVTVSEKPIPVCEFFTANPNQLGVGGGNVTLDWKVKNATDVTIEPTLGTVGLIGTKVVAVTQSTTFKLTAKDTEGKEASCVVPVSVADPAPFTCGGNVSFTASETSIKRGQNVTLDWSTTDVDSLTISHINLPGLSGTEVVAPTDSISYILTATQGSRSIECPLSISVSGGGGGGGSSPRCDLEISDSKIKSGEEVTLTWDTSNTTEVTLRDDKGKILFTTDDLLSSDKKEYLDGSIKVKPIRDTKYTLTAERGSRDRECSVEVEMDDLVVLQSRDQQPLVAGISLSQVPYTGFEAGPIMTILFYMLLVAWALYITYALVIRKSMSTGDSDPVMDMPSFGGLNKKSMQKAEQVRPDVFVQSTSPTTTQVESGIPTNLPTGSVSIGYENHVESEIIGNAHQATSAAVTELENRAHSQKALLSSDAVRYFVATTEGVLERNESLDEVIAEAKKTYPLEDGWIVVNEARMQNLCKACKINSQASSEETFVPATIPEGTGSLAEAIVTGNVIAAYEMIGNRPMFALADAAADFDAVYRHRKGADVKVSNLLITETEKLSDEKIKNMITALTGAIDGTYTDEASAVKMAIMKAVKEVA